MMPLSELLGGMSHNDGAWQAHVPADWQQGRTTYGGLTAALCVEAALRAVPGLPPLRSAQFAFVGPAGGALRITTTILRQGKSTVFLGADVFGAQGLATHATLCFGARRESALHYGHLPMPAVAPPDQCRPFWSDYAPVFSQHFDYRKAGGAGPATGASEPRLLIWLRHKDAGAGHAAPALIALADAPPPAAMAMFAAPAPISTMTWSIDLFAAPDEAPQAWRLIESRADNVGHGYSGQAMTLWTAGGAPLLVARQNVAVFS